MVNNHPNRNKTARAEALAMALWEALKARGEYVGDFQAPWPADETRALSTTLDGEFDLVAVARDLIEKRKAP